MLIGLIEILLEIIKLLLFRRILILNCLIRVIKIILLNLFQFIGTKWLIASKFIKIIFSIYFFLWRFILLLCFFYLIFSLLLILSFLFIIFLLFLFLLILFFFLLFIFFVPLNFFFFIFFLFTH